MKKYLFGLASLSLVGALYGCDNEESCVDEFDCPSGQICQEGVCQAPGGDDECVVDAECNGYACGDSGVCETSCSTEDQCAPGFDCDAGACVEGSLSYNTVLLVSRTPNDSSVGGDCREPNPGPDIDLVELIVAGERVAPATAEGEHGSYCGSADVTVWAEPGVALELLSMPEQLPGECTTENAATLYYFMGSGQAYEPSESIGEDTGYLRIGFDQAFEDGDIVKVWEVNGGDSEDENLVCTNIDTERPNDIYGVYLVSDRAPAIVRDVKDEEGAVVTGTALTAPHFIYLGDQAGVSESLVILD